MKKVYVNRALYNVDSILVLVPTFDPSRKNRADRRYNHIEGFQRKMSALKGTTGDDVVVEIHQNRKSRTVRRWSTDMSLFTTLHVTSPPVLVARISNNSSISSNTASSNEDSTLTDSTPLEISTLTCLIVGGESNS